ncbi:uncharacterized protein G2W53_000764 [Senna tora]|uniref:Uncharacterized protein n=1 Tax=Senna tora TaxID=362788 RepID=A0A834XGC9_9FABA|nr:uncharacterized protein G2W53_000764 [Senna tora]
MGCLAICDWKPASVRDQVKALDCLCSNQARSHAQPSRYQLLLSNTSTAPQPSSKSSLSLCDPLTDRHVSATHSEYT